MIAFEQARDEISMSAVAEKYTSLKTEGRELHGPCPFCGGDDRFMVFRDDQKCFCRQCRFKGDIFDLVAKADNITNAEAYEKLTGLTLRKRSPITDTSRSWREEEWQSEAKEVIEAGSKAMVTVNGASAGWHYLTGRKLTPATISAFSIGFAAKRWDGKDNPKRPAILIPWILANGLTCALKYRFVDELGKTDRKRRFNQKGGSTPLIFGSHLCKNSDLLVCIEGEINAMSVYQAKPETVDVISFGSDSAGGGEKRTNPNDEKGIRAALDFARSRAYSRVLIWCDDKAKAQNAGTIFQEFAPSLMQSPRGKDANDILCEHDAQLLWGLIEARSKKTPFLSNSTRVIIDRSQEVLNLGAAREAVETLYRIAPPDMRQKLMTLDGLIATGTNPQKAVELADEVAAWAGEANPAFRDSFRDNAEPMLEGLALRAKIIELFQTKGAA